MKKLVRLILRTFVAPPRTLDCKLAANVHLVLQLTRLQARVLRDAERLREGIGGPRLGFGSLPPFTMYGAVQRWPVVGDIVLEETAVMCDMLVSLTKKLQNFAS